MIPQIVVAGLYATTVVVLVFSTPADFGWHKAPRVFLTAVMAAWAVYWFGVSQHWDIRIMHMLGRWLHVPVVVAVLLIAGTRWYADRKGAP